MRQIARSCYALAAICPFLIHTAAAQSTADAESRAAALVARMSLREKVSQMRNDAPAIPRLGIPAYEWWNESLHGVARAGPATVFPQAIGLAATWDADLLERVGAAIAAEARIKYQPDGGRFRGLTFWSPNINLFRDPRWGRGQETYGEDPLLAGKLAAAYVRGLQGNDPERLKAIATPKHFAVHSGPESLRHSFNVDIADPVLSGTYLAAFETAVREGGAASVMCAYNAVNGDPACASPELLTTRLRGEWGFKGYVVSDCGAIGDIFTGHKKAASLAEAAAMAVKAGTDLACGSEFDALVDAVDAGLIAEADINRAVTRLFAARFRLGMFDDPSAAPERPDTFAVALEAARKSVVLLSNNGVLPLNDASKRIALIGPAADDPTALLANYSGVPSTITTLLEGLRARFADVRFALGSTYTASTASLIAANAFPDGLRAQYFAGTEFAGSPLVNRIEPRVYLNWDMQDPEIGSRVPRESFSVRWIGHLRAPFDGEYSIGVTRAECHDCTSHDEAAIWIDGQPLVDVSTPAHHPRRTQLGKLTLEAGHDYEIRVEYKQSRGGVGIELVWIPPAEGLLREAITIARETDVVILAAGLNADLEGEESDLTIAGFQRGDRTTLALPETQLRLARNLFDVGKPVVLVLQTGSAVTLPGLEDRPAAILAAWYGGEAGGAAAAETITGRNNPSGRLPVTFYRSDDQLPPFEDYSMTERTYRYFTGDPWFRFGHGLSYSNIEYRNARASALGQTGCEITVTLVNPSDRDAEEVVQLYRAGTERQEREPLEMLVQFERVGIPAKAEKTVHFTQFGPGAAYRISGVAGVLTCN